MTRKNLDHDNLKKFVVGETFFAIRRCHTDHIVRTFTRTDIMADWLKTQAEYHKDSIEVVHCGVLL